MSLDAQRIVDNVEAALNAHRKSLRTYLASAPTPPGMESPTDEQFREFVASMIQQYPPVPLLFPVIGRDGLPQLDLFGDPMMQERELSPWIAMLYLRRRNHDGKPTSEPLVDGADAVLHRYERLMTAGGA